MRRKILGLVTIALVGTISLLLWYNVSHRIPTDKIKNRESTVIETLLPESVGAPIRIRIASIMVDAAIEYVTLAADGSMAVPNDPSNTGWYSPGPRPGEIGSAVIAGHVNWVHNEPAVFANLHDVQIGDTVTVQDSLGKDLTFIVRAIRTYAAKADATDIFTSQDHIAHVNLVTCSGAWDTDTQQYTDRLVIFTDRVIQ